MPKGIQTLTEDWKRKIGLANSIALKGKPRAGNPKNWKHTAITKEKLHITATNQKRQPHSVETRNKMALAKKGYHHTEETKQKMSKIAKSRFFSVETRKKISQAAIRMWANPEKKNEIIKKVRKTLYKKPTKPEQRIIDLIAHYHLPYKYVGDGSVILLGLNPDFININGAKKVIEVFGVAFHDPVKSFIPMIRLTQQEDYRKALLASIGFNCLFLWDTEIAKLSDNQIVEKIKTFTATKKKPIIQLALKKAELE